MKEYRNLKREEWMALTKRPAIQRENLEALVEDIICKVKSKGDQALIEFAKQFDKVEIQQLQVSRKEIEEAKQQVNDKLKNAINIAAGNIRKFHASQKNVEQPIETMKGISYWRKSTAIERVGFYIPGGSAPLFSTILMLGIPAQLAGCKKIILCTPTDKTGKVNPVVLYTADLLGITQIYKVGGAQAIAAMAYGTMSIPKVDKIFGPGNQFVTKAKELIQRDGIAIDLPAGPSEVLVIADEKADESFVAADLLYQAEHGTDSQVVLLTNNESIAKKVLNHIEIQLSVLPRASLAAQTLKNSFSLTFPTIEECIQFSNAYAPEHLILNVENAEKYINQIQNAGSVFLGQYACESAGDYASGTNHTLPTNGYAKSYNGLSLDSFVKKITFQTISREGLLNIGETIEIMAEAEQLIAHKNAVTIRMNKIKNIQ